MGSKVPTMKKGDIGQLVDTSNVPPDKATMALRRTLLVKKLNTGRCTTPQELADRFEQLFETCVENGFMPNVEMLAIASGINRRDLWEIETGLSHKGSGMGDIIKEAKELIAATEGQMALAGDINATTYIFRGKNFFGMVDKQEVVVTPNTKLETPMNAEEIVNNIPELGESN